MDALLKARRLLIPSLLALSSAAFFLGAYSTLLADIRHLYLAAALVLLFCALLAYLWGRNAQG